jgi:hypothetical protein
LILLSLIVVLPVVSSAVFLSVGPSLVIVGFGSSFQLLCRTFSFRHDGGGGGGGGRRSGKSRVVDQTAGIGERASTPLSICLSDPQGRDDAVAQEGAQNNVKKGVHFGTHRSRVSVHASHWALIRRSPCLTLLTRCEC